MSDHSTDEPDPDVRRDVGGWISGPMLPDPDRQLYTAIVNALDCPPPRTGRDEVTYFRTLRDRARVVLNVIARLASDDDVNDMDVLMAADAIQQRVADFPVTAYDRASGGSGGST